MKTSDPKISEKVAAIVNYDTQVIKALDQEKTCVTYDDDDAFNIYDDYDSGMNPD